MKVVQNWYADGWMVVADDWGEQRETPTGVKFRYEPVPLCRCSTGYGRTLEDARAIAERICRLLNEEGVVGDSGADPVTGQFRLVRRAPLSNVSEALVTANGE